jgi:hypothetical protein
MENGKGILLFVFKGKAENESCFSWSAMINGSQRLLIQQKCLSMVISCGRPFMTVMS